MRTGCKGKYTGMQKKSDSSILDQKDINTMFLQQCFSNKTARHSYTNHSGPQTFRCVDATKTVCKPVPYSTLERCEEVKTHSCECIAGCY